MAGLCSVATAFNCVLPFIATAVDEALTDTVVAYDRVTFACAVSWQPNAVEPVTVYVVVVVAEDATVEPVVAVKLVDGDQV